MDGFFFSIALIYISQSPFIKKRFKAAVARSPVIPQQTALVSFFKKQNKSTYVVFIWTLVPCKTHGEKTLLFHCADLLCWQSVRNICFGRCCDHMILSIHKVPACPFTGTVHCFALHRRSHFLRFTVQMRHTHTHGRQRSGCESLVYVKGPRRFIFASSYAFSHDFFFSSCVGAISPPPFPPPQRESSALSSLSCRRGFTFNRTPIFLSSATHWSEKAFIDLTHRDVVLDFTSLCNVSMRYCTSCQAKAHCTIGGGNPLTVGI